MRNASLDVLRGVALLLVVGRHAAPEELPGAGLVGVVAFFALSGFLITGVLLTDLERHGRVRFGRFYARRAARLVPALLVLVAGVVLVTLLLDPLGDRDVLGGTVAVALTWTANLPLGVGTSDATFHLWTLATEEQFYLVWPAVLAVGCARGRLRGAVVTAGVLAVLACVATTAWLAEDPDLAYALPTSWATCFVLGGATQVAVCSGRLAWRPPPWVVGACLTALVVAGTLPLRGHAATYLLLGPAVATLTCLCVLGALARPAVGGPLRVLAWLGTLSYGAYLWNYPLTLWLRPALGDRAWAVVVPLTLLVAYASWRLVERPLLDRLTGRRRPGPDDGPRAAPGTGTGAGAPDLPSPRRAAPAPARMSP